VGALRPARPRSPAPHAYDAEGDLTIHAAPRGPARRRRARADRVAVLADLST